MSLVIEYAILGLASGALTSLMAVGVVLSYRASGVINFANGSIGLWAALVFYELQGHTPTAVAIAAGIAAAALLGAAMHVLIMRPLRGASPLARVIATLGALALLQGTALQVLHNNSPSVQPFLPQSSVHLPFNVIMGADSLYEIAIALVLFSVMWAIFRFTRFGLLTTVVAASERIAASEGHSPDLIATVNWAVGGALAGVAGIVLVPLVGVNAENMTLLVVPALAAAVFGSFSSFPLTLLGALVIGILESEMADIAPTYPGMSTAVPFAIIIVIITVRGRALTLRSYVQDRMPLVGSGEIKPIPVLIGLAMGLVLIFSLNTLWLGALITTLGFAIICVSVVVVTGFAGQLSLAQYTIAGIGVWAAAWGTQHLSLPFWVAVLVGTIAAIPAGIVFAIPALRTRGVSLAVVSLSLAFVVYFLFFNEPQFSGGFTGFSIGEPKLFGWNVYAVTNPSNYAIVVLGALGVSLLAAANVRRGRTGRRLLAVRSNERAAASLGVSVFGAKLYAFGLGAAIAGLGGVMIAFRSPYVLLNTFDVFSSINALLFTVIGGIGYVGGAVVGGLISANALGAFVFQQLLHASTFFQTWGGALLIVTLLTDPNGIIHYYSVLWSAVKARSRSRFGRPADGKHPRPAASDTVNADGSVRGAHRVRPATLEVRDLTVKYGAVTAVDHLSFTVEPGQVFGVIGPNGAGKTTLIDAISGFTKYEGSISVDSRPFENLRVHDRARAGVGRSFQSLELFEELSVRDNLRAASEPRDGRAYLSDLVWPKQLPLSPAALAAIKEFDLEDDLDRRPSELPHGRRHIVAMARAVASEPSVLLLDEPAAGLDERESRELATLIRRIATDWGFAIVLIEHDVSLVRSVSDRILAIDFGRKIAEGEPEAVCADPAVVRAYLGQDVSDLPVAAVLAKSVGEATT